MQVKLNGNIIDTESKNILELLLEYSIERKSVAVAVNTAIIKQEKWDSYKIKNNDTIECLTFMGGG
ncbi:sulfur carrier protein ThiS [Helicobacter turcicus]|uniref:Sulfur carrier protein ThiS n=1 Tax=Helicobacter turcicus TaxID=2867412 RepID=A0ABS7JKP3_9HELI|nr:sulfur carrier protein ThiS [Helicobacter turcicus]MBX7489963.1 sulfur carrier protein ThiS [Helicobacter turcicus]MBX7544822.1 sulfur carrier protein ThiS [Helicobacter turcicus]